MVAALPPLYAHRLGRQYGPDSSRQALAGTLAGPGAVAGLETDVCLTRDGELALLHDPLLTLGTTLEGWARDRAAGEIRAGWIRRADGSLTAEHPLFLEDLLPLVPDGLRLQLEVKAHADPELARLTALALAAALHGDRIRDRCEVISFHPIACEAAAAAGLRSRLVIWASYVPSALASWAVHAGVGGVTVEHFLLSHELVDVLRDAGLSINTGTINRVELLERALAFSPDAICTDRPHELQAEAAASPKAAAA